MRSKLNLDLVSLDRVMVLIHGANASGKTHLQGDFLRWAKAKGEVAFINLKGEDGWGSISGMSLGQIGESADTLKDFDEIIAEFAKKPKFAVAIDSLLALEDMVVMDLIPGGALRYPDPKLDGERAKMLWGQIKMGVRARVVASRTCAQVVLWVATQDKAEELSVGEGYRMAPDLIGKSARRSAGWFDFVGEIKADTRNANSVVRTVSFAPSTSVLTRQRVAKQITAPIPIPEGQGGWEAIWKALQGAMPGGK